MSCNGCIYLIGKEATCPMIYACNTGGEKPRLKPEVRKTKPKSRKEKEEENAHIVH